MYGWCLWGVLRVLSGLVGDHLHSIQRWFDENPYFEKNGRFSLCACGNGVNLYRDASQPAQLTKGDGPWLGLHYYPRREMLRSEVEDDDTLVRA